MTSIHRVISACAIDECTLVVEFDNHQKKKYSMQQLFEREMFAPLKDPQLFKSVKVEQGGYAIYWNENIDLSEYELWQNGILIH